MRKDKMDNYIKYKYYSFDIDIRVNKIRGKKSKASR